MIRDYDGLLTSATTAMIEKLLQNANKPGFDSVTITKAQKRMHQEGFELDEAILSYLKKPSLEGVINVRAEASDVANFAAMIIYKCDKLITEMESLNGKAAVKE